MVLFDNVKIGQRVEVRWRGEIVPGTTKYKGNLNGVRGEWVGVALDHKIGRHDGMIKGRRYFLCDDGHGIFTLASQIRFLKLQRYLYNSYRTLDSESILEEELFGAIPKASEDHGWTVNGMTEKIHSGRFIEPTYALAPPAPSRTLRHSASATIPPATWRRPESARNSLSHSFKKNPYHYQYENDSEDFIQCSSIPLIHMPPAALKRQVRRGWENVPMVRYWNVHSGREDIKRGQWNDISA